MTAEIFVLADMMDKILKVQCSLVSDDKFNINKFSLNKFSINKSMCSLVTNDNTTTTTNTTTTINPNADNFETEEGNIII